MINATVVGNLGKDPELHPGEHPRCKFSVASNSRTKEGGEWVDVTTWVNVVVWGRDAENCAKFLRAGAQVTVAGMLVLRKYTTKSGERGSSLEFEAARNGVKFGQRDRNDSGGGQRSAPPSAEIKDGDIPF